MDRRVVRERLVVDGVAHYQYYWLNTEGKRTYPKESGIDVIGDFCEGRIIVKKDGFWGYVNLHGDTVGKIQYDTVRDYDCGYARVERNELWTFLDLQGNEICEPQFYFVWNFDNGIALVASTPTDYGFINTKGEKICEPIYKSACRYGRGIRLKQHNSDEIIYMDMNGNIVGDCDLL